MIIQTHSDRDVLTVGLGEDHVGGVACLLLGDQDVGQVHKVQFRQRILGCYLAPRWTKKKKKKTRETRLAETYFALNTTKTIWPSET